MRRARRYGARVGGVHAVDVGVDLADVCLECSRQGDRRCVGPAPAQRRRLGVARDALKAGHQRDLAAVERGADALRVDLEDLRPAVGGVGDDPRLRPGEAHRLATQPVHGHGEQRAAYALAGRQQDVELAGRRLRRDLAGLPHEIVGGVAAGRDDGADALPAVVGLDDPAGDVEQARGVGHRRAAVLLHDEVAGHKGHRLACRIALRSRSASYTEWMHMLRHGAELSRDAAPKRSHTPKRTQRCRRTISRAILADVVTTGVATREGEFFWWRSAPKTGLFTCRVCTRRAAARPAPADATATKPTGPGAHRPTAASGSATRASGSWQRCWRCVSYPSWPFWRARWRAG